METGSGCHLCGSVCISWRSDFSLLIINTVTLNALHSLALRAGCFRLPAILEPDIISLSPIGYCFVAEVL